MSARLSADTLARIPAVVGKPRYDVLALRPGIVHLGPGAFHRAHQAVFTEDAIEAAGGDWGIIGVSLRHADTPEALNRQDGLYTVEFLGDELRYRVVGVERTALAAPAQPQAVVDAIAAPQTSIVTLTITEKGYCLRPDGALDFGHPDVAFDLARPAVPRSAVGWLLAGLARRRELGRGPLTVIACDNLAEAGAKLRGAVLAMAERWDRPLADWIAADTAFPATMVDCITPAATPASRARIDAALGLSDAAGVSREAFAEWVIEDRFAGPRPAWERAGVELVGDVSGHQQLKLHVLNAAHSALAYLGLRRGLHLVREAIADPELAAFVDAMVACEIAPALTGLPVADYWRRARARFANPALDHDLAQIAEDGSAKLAQRIYPLLVANARGGRKSPRLAGAARAWIELASRGQVKDPQSARLAAWRAAGGDPTALLDDASLFPESLRAEPAARAALLEAAV